METNGEQKNQESNCPRSHHFPEMKPFTASSHQPPHLGGTGIRAGQEMDASEDGNIVSAAIVVTSI